MIPAMSLAARFKKNNPWNRSEVLEEFHFHQPMDVVQGLAKFKTPLLSFPKWSLNQKTQWLQNVLKAFQIHEQQIIQSESLFQGLPQSFVREYGYVWVVRYVESYLTELQNQPSATFLPVGLVSLMPGRALGFRQIAERLIPALLTGNCAVVMSHSESRCSAQLWQKILQETGLPEGVVQFFDGDQSLAEFLMKHPAFKSISYVGSTNFIESLWPGLPLLRKSYSFALSTKNSLAILPETSDEQIRAGLQSCWMGWGELSSNMHRIFCVDADLERVAAIIQIQLQRENLHSKYGVRLHNDISSTREVLQNAGGKFLSDQQDQPLVYMNLSNCSALQQDPAPVVTLNSVKYVHEMAKWINNGYLGHSAMVLGQDDKARNLAHKLEVSHTWINDWLLTDQDRMIVHGQKMSYKGDLINSLQSKLWQYTQS